MTFFRSAFRASLRAIFKLAFRVEVSGTVPQDAARLLVIANHESAIDGVLLGLFLPFDPVYVVHTSVEQHWLYRWVLRLIDYVAVDPTNSVAMKSVIKIVESGRPVVVFPEGRLTTTGSLMKTYDGPAFVAARTGATILPVHIDGAARTYFSRLSDTHPHEWLPKILIDILPVTRIDMPAEDGEGGTEYRRRAGEKMRRIMQEMIFTSRPRQTLFDALLSAMSIYGASRGVIEDAKQNEYSYRDLLKMALVLGRRASKVSTEGACVAVLLPNVMATLAMVFGLTAFRRVPAMLNYTAGADGIQSACETAKAKVLFTSRLFIAQAELKDVIASLHDIEILYLEDVRSQLDWKDKLWLFGWAMWVPRLATRRSTAEDPAVVLFTSGTESKPKGVVLSHRAILANVAQIRAVADLSVADKFLNVLPLFHSFGLTGGGVLPIIIGARIVLYPSPLHYKLIPELAYDRNCTVLLGTSTFLGNYAKYAHPYDFYRLRYVIAGAERLANSVREAWFEKFGIRILEGYGATETAPVLAVNTPMAYRSHTVGQLLPGIHSMLMPVSGVARGGQLHVSGPNLMSGYYRPTNPGVLEKPASYLGEGWYDTGDIVEIDDDGFVRIVGRVKRFAKVAGEMVSLESVEQMARQASPYAAHASTSIADETRGEVILLFTTDRELTRDKLLAAAKEGGWPEIALPRKIVVVDELPLLGTGKTDYVTLKKMAEAQ